MASDPYRKLQREKSQLTNTRRFVFSWFAIVACTNTIGGNQIDGSQELAVAPKTAPVPTTVVPILLFNGTGTSPTDVAAIEAILKSSDLKYLTVDSFQLNRMEESQISRYRLFVVPGGNFVDMGSSLTSATTAKVRSAVKGGLNYLGICAGGFLAGSFPSPYNSFNLSGGVKFGFYSVEVKGVHKAAVRITTAEGYALDQYWEDGPQFNGWGDIVGKYPDGSPAIVEGSVGLGRVILSGVHPEAPESWRRGIKFATPVIASTAYAKSLIDAALNGRDLVQH